MEKLTKRQNQVLKFIKDFISNHGYPPSIRDIAKKFEIYVRGAYDHVKALEKKGYIIRERGKNRSINLIPKLKTSELSQFPILGQVSAGNPLEAVENFEDMVVVSKNLFKGKDLFSVKVRGNSMIGIGIFEDDYVVVKAKEEVRNGDIVVALLNGETTIKRIFFEKDVIKLQPENPDLKPIYSKDVQVIGKVIGLLRKF